MHQHIKAVGWIYIVYHGIGVLVGFMLFSLLVGGGVLSGDPEVMGITGLIGIILAFFFVTIALPGIIGGIYLLKYQNWARILILILSFINLFAFPIGTVVGVYAIWTLIHDKTVPLFNKEH